MAEETHSAGVEISALGGTLRMFGGNALFFFLMLLLALNIGLTLWAHTQRSAEHAQISCAAKLSIYIYTTPKGAPIDWERLPVDTFSCIPKFLFDRPALPRGG